MMQVMNWESTAHAGALDPGVIDDEAAMPAPPGLRYHCLSRRADLRERRRQDQHLAQALSRGRLTTAATPRFALGDLSHRADEVALRWRQDMRVATPAAAALANTSDPVLARALSMWLLQQGCARQGECVVSLLLPQALPKDAALVAAAQSALRDTRRPGPLLELRFDEVALLDPSTETLLCLSALRDLGVLLAVEDFGRRIGSLAMLRHLPLTAIRLDPSLTHEAVAGTEEGAMLQALAGMAHPIGIGLVARAVDSAAQQQALCALGLDEGLGRFATGRRQTWLPDVA